jgi:hypothetical protein
MSYEHICWLKSGNHINNDEFLRFLQPEEQLIPIPVECAWHTPENMFYDHICWLKLYNHISNNRAPHASSIGGTININSSCACMTRNVKYVPYENICEQQDSSCFLLPKGTISVARVMHVHANMLCEYIVWQQDSSCFLRLKGTILVARVMHVHANIFGEHICCLKLDNLSDQKKKYQFS